MLQKKFQQNCFHQKKNLTQKPRLLIIINRLVIGGQAADTVSLASFLKNDFNIVILHGQKEKDEVVPPFPLKNQPGIQQKKIRFLKKTINPFNDFITFFSILYIIVRFRPHIVHTHGAKPGLFGRLAAKLAGVPVIIHTFHGHFFHSYFSKLVSAFIAWLERAIGKITTCAVALSASQKHELANEYKILPEKKIKIVPLGFDFDNIEDYAALRERFRKKYDLLQSDVAIGIVGRIVPVKNHSFFVKVIDKMLAEYKTNPPAFFIIGDGDLRLKIEEELRQKNIFFNNRTITAENRVVFTSWLTNVGEVMNGLDMVALTSLNEGTPLSVIEAQFFKKPVVSTDAGGVKDSMQDGITGFLIEKNDVAAFCNKLSVLIDNKNLRQTMGESGNKFILAKFSKQKEITATKNLYFSFLEKKGYHFK